MKTSAKYATDSLTQFRNVLQECDLQLLHRVKLTGEKGVEFTLREKSSKGTPFLSQVSYFPLIPRKTQLEYADIKNILKIKKELELEKKAVVI